MQELNEILEISTNPKLLDSYQAQENTQSSIDDRYFSSSQTVCPDYYLEL